MITCLDNLRKKYTLGFVGGSDVNKQIEQLGKANFELFTWRFSENGLLGYNKDKCIHQRSFLEALGEIAPNTEIYVDMDGVLADFFGEWTKSQGVSNWKDIKDPMKAIGDIKSIEDFWFN